MAFVNLTVMVVTLLTSTATPADSIDYQPGEANLAAREWFQDAKFGLFVHWGVYSVLGRGEWVMHREEMSVEEYEKLPPQFNPVNFDADQWCRMAKDAGMKYITITSKHHDGFAMFDSKVSDYDIIDGTPYKRDVLKLLTEACQRHGLKLFFYHSHLDWHHPDYFPRGRTGQHSGRPDAGEWYAYLDYLDGQIKELCTNYGAIGGIWFDGWWDKRDADWRLQKTYDLIHGLQPQALIGNNHHRAPFPGEDFQMFEKGMPGADPYSKDKHISQLPLETCETINKSWGYNKGDEAHKSTKELIHLLVNAAGHSANLLLNVGPKPDGTIQEEHQERLAQVGRWLGENGSAIYGTRSGPVPPQSWGATTQKGDLVFVHVLHESDTVVALSDFGRRTAKASLLTGEALDFESTSLGTIIRLPEAGRDPFDTVVVLTTIP